MTTVRAAWLLALLLWQGVATAAEPLSFTISYRGVFSAMAWLDIAHASYYERQSSTGDERRLAELHVSSERLPAIESLYPIRYLFRSLAGLPAGASIAFERYRRYREPHHMTFVVDRRQPGLQRYKPTSDGPGERPAWRLPAADLTPHGEPLALPAGVAVHDQLAMIRGVRELDWSRTEHRLTATNGKRIIEYLLTRQPDEVVDWHGRAVDCLRIRVVGRVVDGEDEYGRRRYGPIDVWLSADTRRLPILAENAHALGLFRVQLLPDGAPGTRVASVVEQLEVADIGDLDGRLVDHAVRE